MKIGILELCSKNHYVLVDGWFSVAGQIGANAEVIASPDLQILLDSQFSKSAPPPSFFAKVAFLYKWMKTCDLVVITSLQSQWLLFFVLGFVAPRVRIWTTIHNAQTWGDPLPRRGVIEIGKALAKGVIRRRWISLSEQMVVNSSNMLEFMKGINPTLAAKCKVMPFRLWNGSDYGFRSLESQILTIAIPGMISKKRRNYQVFERLCSTFGSKIELRFLGAPNAKEGGTEIFTMLSGLSAKFGTKVFLTNEYLRPLEFDQLIIGSHLILANVEVNYSWYDYRETYGVSKDSGLSYAMINFQLPGLFNREFKNLQELESSTLYYSTDDDLVFQIKNLLEKPSYYANIARSAVDNSMQFSVDKVVRRLELL